jgi:TDG/mug DNA glycosylase family protein
VAFAGKRQFLELVNVGKRGKARAASVATGRQQRLPEGWPLPASSEVWVCSSTSGASALTKQQREGPWLELAARLAAEPWPRAVACCPGAGGRRQREAAHPAGV